MTVEMGQRMAQLRTRFAARLTGDCEAIAKAFAAGDLPRVRHLAHGLAGIAGSFGHAAVGDAAYDLEQAIENDPEATSGLWLVLEALMKEASRPPSLQM